MVHSQWLIEITDLMTGGYYSPHPHHHSNVIRVVLPLSMWRGVAVPPNSGGIVGVRW